MDSEGDSGDAWAFDLTPCAECCTWYLGAEALGAHLGWDSPIAAASVDRRVDRTFLNPECMGG